jgi:hypothetical protein
MVSDLQLMRPDPDCLITRNMCGFVRVKTGNLDKVSTRSFVLPA